MEDTKKFLEEYQAWSLQEKYKKFPFIIKLSPVWKNRLLSREKFNIWALLLGPLYFLFSGFAVEALFSILLILFLGILFAFQVGVSAFLWVYGLVAVTMCFCYNGWYLRVLKKDMKALQHFNPDADTPYFNIGWLRLLCLSVLSGGLYFLYWNYRNLKALKQTQGDARAYPVTYSIFMNISSMHTFRAINYSVQLTPYYKRLVPWVSAILTFIFVSGVTFKEVSNIHSLLITVVLWWLFIVFQFLVINKYQNAIRFYCHQKNLPEVKGFTFWEILLVVFGFVSSTYPIIKLTLFLIKFM